MNGYEPMSVVSHGCPDCRCVQRAEAAAFSALLCRDDGRRSPDGICYGFEDGLDGFAVHAEGCRHVGQAAFGPGSSCPQQGRWRGEWPAWAARVHG